MCTTQNSNLCIKNLRIEINLIVITAYRYPIYSSMNQNINDVQYNRTMFIKVYSTIIIIIIFMFFFIFMQNINNIHQSDK